MNFLESLVEPSSFPPRWNSGNWTNIHGWTHILSDFGIFLAFLSISVTLFWFVSQRKDLFFRGVFQLFGGFILLCGFAHLLEAVIFWEPLYRISALVKAATAIISWVTVIAVIRNLPDAVNLPGLKKVNDQMRREIDRRKVAELEAEQVREELKSMLFVASHDLREPVRGIVSFTEILQKESAGKLDETSLDLLDRISKGGKHLSSLIENIQSLAHLREDKRKIAMVDARQSIKTALEEMNPLIYSKSASITVSDRLPQLFANEFWLERIFFNLLSNAVKFAPEGETPLIEIKALDKSELSEDTAGIVISDKNETIPEQKTREVFDLFKRNTGRGIDGTGAGLAIVRAAAKRYGGRVWHEAREGGGNHFKVTFYDAPVDSIIEGQLNAPLESDSPELNPE